MLRRWSVVRVRAELGALEASAERAGAALACVYSSSDEFEASEIRRRLALMRLAGQLRIALWATAVAAFVTLVTFLL